jgi:ribosomal-protein-alanine N-acetyltransferase
MNKIIQKMVLSDLDEVIKIEKTVFPDPWSLKSFQFELLANKYSHPLVLIVDNNLIGYAVIWKIFEEFHIANIAIDPDFQGKGWGTYFLAEILKQAAKQKYCLLEVRENNPAAIHIYEKLGFKKESIRYRYYANGDNAIIMKKILHSPQEAYSKTVTKI